jgi:hypothetical protein
MEGRQMIVRRVYVADRHWIVWIASMWLLILIAAYGPSVERNLLPVVSKFDIIQIEPDGTGSRVYARFEKYRSCEFLGINWDRIDSDGARQRAVLNLKPTNDVSGSTRPPGKHIAGSWYVGMSPDQLIGHSEATIAYRCHPFWITEVKVWP